MIQPSVEQMDEPEAPDDDDLIELERLINSPDPTWWDYDMLPWDYLFPSIPF